MKTVTISKRKIEKEAGMVILPVKEYQKLIVHTIPTYYLTGKEAKKLDSLVVNGLKEYKSGKTKIINSLADLN